MPTAFSALKLEGKIHGKRGYLLSAFIVNFLFSSLQSRIIYQQAYWLRQKNLRMIFRTGQQLKLNTLNKVALIRSNLYQIYSVQHPEKSIAGI